MSEREELIERLDFLKKRLLTLEWDKSLNQLNSGMEQKLAEYRTELAGAQKRLSDLPSTPAALETPLLQP